MEALDVCNDFTPGLKSVYVHFSWHITHKSTPIAKSVKLKPQKGEKYSLREPEEATSNSLVLSDYLKSNKGLTFQP